MSEGSGSAARRVLLLGDTGRAADLAAALEADGIAVLRAPSAPVALATLDSPSVDCLVAVDDEASTGGRPDDFFGAAFRRGHHVPGVFVGAEARALPPGVEQAPPSIEAAAAQVRQRLLTREAEDAEPLTTEDPLAAYGSTVAHELRNHLEAAGMAVESLDGPTKERAEAALDRLADLATEAEAVASGRVSRTESVSLAEAAAEAADRVHASNATVTIDASESVEANPALVTLLFENLFRNSVEHGGPEVTVRVQDTDRGFLVADDGPGFESDHPFEWGYTTGSGQGTGLAVVRRIAQAHGWHVSAGNDGLPATGMEDADEAGDGGARIDVVVD